MSFPTVIVSGIRRLFFLRRPGVQVLLLDYRVAPEHKYPAANDDCLAAYQWLLKNGFSAKNIVIGGESAGGTLTLMTLLDLRDAGDPLPAAGLVLYWFDPIKFDAESYTSRAEADPFFSRKSFQIPAGCYFDAAAATLPASPLSRSMAGLPGLFVLVGGSEVILDDSIRLAERARAAGVDVALEVWEGMPHGFHAFAANKDLAAALPEAKQAVGHIGEFVNKQLAQAI